MNIDPAELPKVIRNLMHSAHYGELKLRLRRDSELKIGFCDGVITTIAVEPAKDFDTERKPTP